MTLLPFKLKKVADGLNVRVSNHFHYTDFGVTDSRVQNHYGRRYVCTGTPGTGFIERESESHSYREFVRGHFRNQRPKYWNLFFNREPDFDREITRARAALDQTTDPMKRNILDAYVNALSVAAVEEEIERIQRGIKDRIGHHDHKKYYVSVNSAEPVLYILIKGILNYSDGRILLCRLTKTKSQKKCWKKPCSARLWKS